MPAMPLTSCGEDDLLIIMRRSIPDRERQGEDQDEYGSSDEEDDDDAISVHTSDVIAIELDQLLALANIDSVKTCIAETRNSRDTATDFNLRTINMSLCREDSPPAKRAKHQAGSSSDSESRRRKKRDMFPYDDTRDQNTEVYRHAVLTELSKITTLQ